MVSLIRQLQRLRKQRPYYLLQLYDRMQLARYSLNMAPKVPLHSGAGNPHNPFFIIGSGRSGNTLLRAILSNHYRIFIPPENSALGNMVRVFEVYRAFPWKFVVAAILEEFSQAYRFDDWAVDVGKIAQAAYSLPQEERSLAKLIELIYVSYGSRYAPDKDRWGDKTPRNSYHLEDINRVFPTAQYIHIIRDGRDVVNSYIKAGFFNGDYIRAAYAWRDATRRCRRFIEKLDDQSNFFELRYEDLVHMPEASIKDLCLFLDLEPTKEILQYQGTSDRISDVLQKNHHQNLQKPISTVSIGKWKQELPQTKLPHIMRIIQKDLELLEYD